MLAWSVNFHGSANWLATVVHSSGADLPRAASDCDFVEAKEKRRALRPDPVRLQCVINITDPLECNAPGLSGGGRQRVHYKEQGQGHPRDLHAQPLHPRDFLARQILPDAHAMTSWVSSANSTVSAMSEFDIPFPQPSQRDPHRCAFVVSCFNMLTGSPLLVFGAVLVSLACSPSCSRAKEKDPSREARRSPCRHIVQGEAEPLLIRRGDQHLFIALQCRYRGGSHPRRTLDSWMIEPLQPLLVFSKLCSRALQPCWRAGQSLARRAQRRR